MATTPGTRKQKVALASGTQSPGQTLARDQQAAPGLPIGVRAATVHLEPLPCAPGEPTRGPGAGPAPERRGTRSGSDMLPPTPRPRVPQTRLVQLPRGPTRGYRPAASAVLAGGLGLPKKHAGHPGLGDAPTPRSRARWRPRGPSGRWLCEARCKAGPGGRLQPLEGARRGGRAAAAAFIGPGSCSSTQGSAPASRAAPPRLVRRRPEGRGALPLGALLGVLLSLAVLKLGQFLPSEALLPGGMVTHSRGVVGALPALPPVPSARLSVL